MASVLNDFQQGVVELQAFRRQLLLEFWAADAVNFQHRVAFVKLLLHAGGHNGPEVEERIIALQVGCVLVISHLEVVVHAGPCLEVQALKVRLVLTEVKTVGFGCFLDELRGDDLLCFVG